MQCPKCKLWFGFGDEDPIISEIEGCTMNCFHCGALLIVESTFARDFHEFLHSQNPNWPVDGKETGYIEI